MNRAFSADVLGNYEPWALPQSSNEYRTLGAKHVRSCHFFQGKIDLDRFDFRLGLRSLALSKL